jgi:acetolactate synthase-1/3 small subunit
MFTNLYGPQTGQVWQESTKLQQDGQLVLSLVVANKPGVLGRIALVFSRRGCNIEYLNVHHTLDRRISHMVIKSKGDVDRFDEIMKQCQKIIDVIHVAPVQQQDSAPKPKGNGLQLEIICENQNKKLILQCLQYSSFQIVHFEQNHLIVEKDHREHTDEAMLAILKHYASIRVIGDEPDPDEAVNLLTKGAAL